MALDPAFETGPEKSRACRTTLLKWLRPMSSRIRPRRSTVGGFIRETAKNDGAMGELPCFLVSRITHQYIPASLISLRTRPSVGSNIHRNYSNKSHSWDKRDGRNYHNAWSSPNGAGQFRI